MPILEQPMNPGNDTYMNFCDSSDEEGWDPYHHHSEMHPTIPFLASEDEDNSGSDVDDEDGVSLIEGLAKRVRSAAGLVEELAYDPKRGMNYATPRKWEDQVEKSRRQGESV